ncbi:MAG: hypothetical protein ACFFFC_04780 [Candidatus Thorarchaeota archaeon]
MQFEGFIYALLGVIYTLLFYMIIFAIIFIIISVLSLGWALDRVGGQDTGFGSVFITSLVMGLVMIIPCLGCVLALWVIKTRHSVGWMNSLIAWIVAVIVSLVIFIAIAFMFLGGLAGLFALFPPLPFP